MSSLIAARRLLLNTSQQSGHTTVKNTLCFNCLRQVHTGKSRSWQQLGNLAQRKATSPSPRHKLALVSPASIRTFASVQDAPRGPIAEYDARVKTGRLTNDEHQRSQPFQNIPAKSDD